MLFDKAIIVTGKTRLEVLIERFNSRSQAQFYIERSGGDFSLYEVEHQTFYNALDIVQQKLAAQLKVTLVPRSFLPTYLFAPSDLIIVLGQDGLVANTAKYVNGLPIIAINPDETRIDGILLPFNTATFPAAFKQVLTGKYETKTVSMAAATMNDGQHLLAFNDFFIGPATHGTARYNIRYRQQSENQISSGILVSTGAGSTGWLSSVFNMTNSLNHFFGGNTHVSQTIPLNSNDLFFVVREPFQSKSSAINVSCGQIKKGEKLIIESNMPTEGIIFSDGIQNDFIHFNAGARVEIALAREQARLVI